MTSQTETAGRLVTGLLLVLLGGLFLFHNLDVIDVGPVSRFWPVVLIVLGLAKLAGREHACGGAWLLSVGVLLLLHTLHVLRLHDSWPLFIVAVGLGILVRSVAPGWCDPRPSVEK